MKKEKLTETIFKVIYDTNNLNATNPFYGAGRGRGGGQQIPTPVVAPKCR